MSDVVEDLRQRAESCRFLASHAQPGPNTARRAGKASAYEHAAELVEAADLVPRAEGVRVALTPRQMARLEVAGWVPGEMALGEWLVQRAQLAAEATILFGGEP